jgi:carboxyl-terminal processing protease
MWSVFAVICTLCPTAQAQESIEGLDEALSEVQANFPHAVTADSLYQAALQGVVTHLGDVMGAELNRVLSPEQYANAEAWMAGQRQGIGAEFGLVPGRGMVLTDVFPDGPADEAGMRSGDLIVSMDNHPFTGLSAGSIHARVRSSQGSSSVFDLRRSDGTIARVEVERGRYLLPPLRHRVVGDALVARIPFFGTGTADALADALAAEDPFSAVVLDLRDNEGGLLEEAVATADQLLEPGAVVVRLEHDGRREQLEGPSIATWSGAVVVLINRGTAGVAEALAAALQDHRRATIVGTRSAGSAMRTSHYPAGRGFVLEIADTTLSPPSGRSWHGTGVIPDIIVEAQQLTISIPTAPYPPDLQRDAALRLISTADVAH